MFQMSCISDNIHTCCFSTAPNCIISAKTMSSTNVKLETTMNLSTCNQQHAKFSHEHKTDHIISGTQKQTLYCFLFLVAHLTWCGPLLKSYWSKILATHRKLPEDKWNYIPGFQASGIALWWAWKYLGILCDKGCNPRIGIISESTIRSSHLSKTADCTDHSFNKSLPKSATWQTVIVFDRATPYFFPFASAWISHTPTPKHLYRSGGKVIRFKALDWNQPRKPALTLN